MNYEQSITHLVRMQEATSRPNFLVGSNENLGYKRTVTELEIQLYKYKMNLVKAFSHMKLKIVFS